MLSASPLHDDLSFQIAASAVGPHQRLTLPHLIRLLQEAAMRNTVRLGISSPELLLSHGCTWVLRRQSLHCLRWPGIGERVRVLTAPTGFERGLLTYRDFHLLDAEGKTCISATTEWLLMDVHTRRIKAIPPHIAALAADLAPATAHLKRPIGKLPPPARPNAERSSHVAFYQLDFNGHLTNPVFPELMIEPLGLAFLETHLPTEVDISFQQEARYGDALSAQSEPATDGGTHFRHALLRDGEVLATMYSAWQAL
ncbi:thioesterase [Neolewinella lacunae]|uniref:Acyl-ACP thioesterase n=1 Tax=Neolewinella lacunae TaxID=1517758 RepID=A0A923PJX5_9BACT|nr:acyl-ACP thioesterase domain-containing protein [Neolewinella lacunae]MBC6992674.1 hypothetical protein [Neolewinella lacunae]MDN3633554.1 thioesterase [Neolewinella lacunae]